MTGPLSSHRPLRERHPITWRAIFWILLIPPALGYELYMVIKGHTDGTLSNLFWRAYGDRWTFRWWVLSGIFNGFSAWCMWHFMFVWPDAKHLVALVAIGLVLGLAGFGVTQLVAR